MNNSCASTDGQSHNLFKLTKIGGIQPNFQNIAAHLPEYVKSATLSCLVRCCRDNYSFYIKRRLKSKNKQDITFSQFGVGLAVDLIVNIFLISLQQGKQS